MATDQPQTNELGPPSPARRQFLQRLSLGLSAVGAAIVGVPFLSFLLAPLLRRPAEHWTAIGP
ncbi:MAG: (2Fe-2S)-binding protein, partial [Chloroflexota bacterium]|nr:(2Fe-2S)-binding protein [Chloroflexota bacterium]